MKKIKCGNCGSIMREKDTFCPNCGKKSAVAEPKPNDNYYENVKPADSERRRKGKMNRDTMIRVGLVGFGFVIVVAACIVALCLL